MTDGELTPPFIITAGVRGAVYEHYVKKLANPNISKSNNKPS